MADTPESYLNNRRPPLHTAMQAENEAAGRNLRVDEALSRLIEKGYFSPRPRPWAVGEYDRGHGHISYGVLDSFGDVVTAPLSKEDAELIVKAVNVFEERGK